MTISDPTTTTPSRHPFQPNPNSSIRNFSSPKFAKPNPNPYPNFNPDLSPPCACEPSAWPTPPHSQTTTLTPPSIDAPRATDILHPASPPGSGRDPTVKQIHVMHVMHVTYVMPARVAAREAREEKEEEEYYA